MEEKFSDREQILERLQNTVVGEDVSENTPEVSVIIPAYNVSKVIADTLESVFSQTFGDFEVILVNDGSTDTNELIDAIAPFRPRLVYSEQENMGCSAARNSAMCLARGNYFAFLDGDDLWYADFLSSQLEFIEKNALDMAYCDADLIGDNYYKHSTYMATAPSTGEVTTTSLLNATCNVITSGTLVKRSCLEDHGLFDQASVRAQDFDLWIRLALNGIRIGYQKKVLLKYRVSSGSLSGSNVARAERGVTVLNFVKNKYEFSEQELAVLEDQLKLCRSEVELEKAKLSLVEKRFDEAASHLRKANEHSGKLKLTILTAMLRIAPRLVLKLFKKLRPGEFAFISPKNT